MIAYRALSDSEIDQLLEQGCSADDWSHIEVADGFNPDYVQRVSFSGWNRLGVMEGMLELEGGFSLHSGLYDVSLHQVQIGNDCYIAHVSGFLSNYQIEDRVYINRVDVMFAGDCPMCGDGLKVTTLDEFNGTPVKMYTGLTAQEAWLMAQNGHNKMLIRQWDSLIDATVRQRTQSRGYIGAGTRILGVGRMEDVYVGPCAVIEGASRLTNCSLLSSEESPVTVGHNVVCEDAIICGGTSLREGTILKECFVSQSCRLGCGFTAMSSFIFSNSMLYAGEVTSSFVGPFATLRHKTDLWTDGIFAFAAVRPKLHHPLEGLLPSFCLDSLTAYRDARRWPTRDKRDENGRLDWIHYHLLNPFNMVQILHVWDLLQDAQERDGEYCESYSVNGCLFMRDELTDAINLCEQMRDIYIGQALVRRLGAAYFEDEEVFASLLKPTLEAGSGEWLDMMGMLVPRTEIETLLDEIEQGDVTSSEEIKSRLQEMYDLYPAYEWTYLLELLGEQFGYTSDNLIPSVLASLLQRYISQLNVWMQGVSDVLEDESYRIDRELNAAKEECTKIVERLQQLD